MKSRLWMMVIFAAALAIGSGAFANEIYKWVDQDGNVHYEDRPSGSDSEQRLALSYKRTDAASIEQLKEDRSAARASREEAEAKQAEEQQATAAAADKEEARKKKCESYRASLDTFANSRRVYRTDDNGERVFLEDDEIQKTRARAEALVAKYCTS
ncbi:MAG: DUF4124 domain-containing protein [Gammaproteobacteria bacterium]|nr:DUF4124 domain-containing protein [Gammaproteobacteria bacterium]